MQAFNLAESGLGIPCILTLQRGEEKIIENAKKKRKKCKTDGAKKTGKKKYSGMNKFSALNICRYLTTSVYSTSDMLVRKLLA